MKRLLGWGVIELGAQFVDGEPLVMDQTPVRGKCPVGLVLRYPPHGCANDALQVGFRGGGAQQDPPMRGDLVDLVEDLIDVLLG